MDMNALTYTGVIATILSLVFAAAAFWNSHIRRKHMDQIKHTEHSATPHVSFKPPPNAPAVKTVDEKPEPVFRQFGPRGDLTGTQPGEDNNTYAWE